MKKGDEIEEEYQEDFDAGNHSISNNIEKPLDLGKVMASQKVQESLVQEELVLNQEK